MCILDSFPVSVEISERIFKLRRITTIINWILIYLRNPMNIIRILIIRSIIASIAIVDFTVGNLELCPTPEYCWLCLIIWVELIDYFYLVQQPNTYACTCFDGSRVDLFIHIMGNPNGGLSCRRSIPPLIRVKG